MGELVAQGPERELVSALEPAVLALDSGVLARESAG